MEPAALSINTWALAADSAPGEVGPADLLEEAWERGVRRFDVAPVYGAGRAERFLGWVLERRTDRESLHLTGKGGIRREEGRLRADHDPQRLREQLEVSLRRLNVSSLDRYHLFGPDPSRRLERTMERLEAWREEGLIRGIGLINPTPRTIERARRGGDVDAVECPVNPFDAPRQGPLLERCGVLAITVVGYDPLYGGLLTERYLGSFEPIRDARVSTYHGEFARDRQRYVEASRRLRRGYTNEDGELRDGDEIPVESVALQWSRQHPQVGEVRLGVRSGRQLRRVVAARTLELPAKRWQEMKQIGESVTTGETPPEFLRPPPLTPSHSFERHVWVRGDGD